MGLDHEKKKHVPQSTVANVVMTEQDSAVFRTVSASKVHQSPSADVLAGTVSACPSFVAKNSCVRSLCLGTKMLLSLSAATVIQASMTDEREVLYLVHGKEWHWIPYLVIHTHRCLIRLTHRVASRWCVSSSRPQIGGKEAWTFVRISVLQRMRNGNDGGALLPRCLV